MKTILPTITIDNIVVCEDIDGSRKYVVGDHDYDYDDSYNDYCGHFYTFHRRYFFGERHSYKDSLDFWEDFYKMLSMECPSNIAECEVVAHSLENYCFIPVYAIIHGSIYLSSTDPKDPWDSGRVGLIYCSKDDYNKYFLRKDDPDWKTKYLQYANDWLEEENDLINGQTYGFIITDAKELEPYKEVVSRLYPNAWLSNLRKAIMAHEEESCFGFHGDYEKLLLEFLRDEGLSIVEVL